MKNKNGFLILLALAFTFPVATIMVVAQTGGNTNALPRPQGPGDIYTAAGTPCVTAHSTTRALYASYNGPLYQVKRQSDGKTLDIGVVQSSATDAGGYADAAAQDLFCAGTMCNITVIYDQSGKGNHLYQAAPGTFKGPAKGAFNTLAIADMAPITISGHKAYGVYIMPGMGYRNNNAAELAINDEPEGIYYVINGKHYDSGCCFDYGNGSTNGKAVGTGTMETTYYGTATAWGSGEGPGPWLMADMEAGLFTGYNAKQNVGSPTINSWDFITAVVNGGGGNQWDLRGGNAQEGPLKTFYSGPRPGTPQSADYYPMNKQGAVLLGNGGDNGNGSAGTFYEGIMTVGYPTNAAIDAVQANIVAARYAGPRLALSRLTTFTPNTKQTVTMTFTNTTGAPVSGVELSLDLPQGWSSLVAGSTKATEKLAGPIAPGSAVNVTFEITSPATTGAGYLTAKAAGLPQPEATTQRIRNVMPVKINEVRFSTSVDTTDQFIELYNASDKEIDISNWSIINTQSQWAPVKLATIPAGTKIAAGDFYLLGLAGSGLTAPAKAGDTVINVSYTTGFQSGQKLEINGESCTIANVGSPATAMTTLFIPVSTGPWLNFPAGTTNLPVTSAAGFEVGQKVGIDIGGNYELVTVTAVGKAATQTTLAADAVAGANVIKLAASENITVGDTLTIDTGKRIEQVKVASITSDGIGLSNPLKLNHAADVDVSDVGTGISFTPATRFAHISGDAIQALGSGITLAGPLTGSHEYGSAIINSQVTTAGYKGSGVPDQWYGGPLSASAGSIALMAADGVAVVDALVYGSQQSSSSANGTIASPELATLEGDQSQGGCIVVAPTSGRGFGRPGAIATGGPVTNKSVGRFPDGFDTDSNCKDFLTQSDTSLAVAAVAGANNIKVASVAGFTAGQSIMVGSGDDLEEVIIASVGTPGASALSTETAAGATSVQVASTAGFSVGQTITIDSSDNAETVVISAISGGGRGPGGFGGPGGPGGRGGQPATITFAAPLTKAHPVSAQVSGSGITLTAELTRNHENGAAVGSGGPTPGMKNKYRKVQ